LLDSSFLASEPTDRTFPGARETFYKYDAKGRLMAQQDANGNITAREYDGLDRVTAVALQGPHCK